MVQHPAQLFRNNESLISLVREGCYVFKPTGLVKDHYVLEFKFPSLVHHAPRSPTCTRFNFRSASFLEVG